MNTNDIVVVGIAGGTASGKTTLARKVVDALGAEDCLLITHDRYYADVEDPATFNYDHPDSLHTWELLDHIDDLRCGRPTVLPDYDFRTHSRKAIGVPTGPVRTILVEGILVLQSDALRSLLDLSVYIDTADDLRLARRIRRDIAERGRSVDEVLGRYLSTVRPMHVQFVEPSRAQADLVLPGVGLLEPLVDSIVDAIDDSRLAKHRPDEGLVELDTDDLVLVDETWNT
ncbi:MAG: uridine kinase [Proteobacteria bacterium]|nr:uridine kinase [Pseudomonadota bacterium]MCP4916326.1 uridine kinase [Pseudomonadota bacterium]